MAPNLHPTSPVGRLVGMDRITLDQQITNCFLLHASCGSGLQLIFSHHCSMLPRFLGSTPGYLGTCCIDAYCYMQLMRPPLAACCEPYSPFTPGGPRYAPRWVQERIVQTLNAMPATLIVMGSGLSWPSLTRRRLLAGSAHPIARLRVVGRNEAADDD